MALRRRWRRDGLLVFPGFLEPEARDVLRAICDGVLARMLEREPRLANGSNIAGLTDPALHLGDAGGLLRLLELAAGRRILEILQAVGEPPVLFHNTQYFYEQRDRDWDGVWHRDTQFDARDPALERRRMAGAAGVHFRVALVPDRWLEYVPGSQARWDTDGQLAIRRGPGPAASEMPGRVRVVLGEGDACLFHAWGIHRGTYRTAPPRRTLDLLYSLGRPVTFAMPGESHLPSAAVRRRLSGSARALFEDTASAYRRLRWTRAEG